MSPVAPTSDAVAGSASCPPLQGTTAVDVAVLGGGYVGLHTALRLVRAAPGCRVAVVERAGCGAGASGRNGGQFHTWWDRLDALTAAVGSDRALWLGRAVEDAIGELAELAGRRPQVQMRADGWLWTASSPAQIGRWTAAVERCAAHGVGHFVPLGADELERRTGSPALLAGVAEQGSGTVDPAGLVQALKAEALAAGVTIYERSPVRSLSDGSPVEVRTDGGMLTAGRVVIAMNAWAARLPQVRPHIFVVGSNVLRTAPGASEWSTGEAVCDSQTRVLYWRATPDRRIVFGRGGGAVAPFNRVGGRFETPGRWARDLEAAFLRIHPGARDVSIERAWSGAVDRSADGLPFFGRRDEWTECGLVDRTPPALPPEPLRSAGAVAVRAAVRAVGRAEDEGRTPSALARRVAALVPA